IPVFNERATIDRILAAVRAADVDAEIIVVDDASSDGTRDRLEQLAGGESRMRVFYHGMNRGKGAALRTGFAAATGRFVVVQDADLEYDPREFVDLLAPLLANEYDVVFGSRFLNGEIRDYSLHTVANRLLTWLSNVCTGLRLTDMETCYKV